MKTREVSAIARHGWRGLSIGLSDSSLQGLVTYPLVVSLPMLVANWSMAGFKAVREKSSTRLRI